MALITLQHTDINSGNKVAIICTNVSVGYKKTTMAHPNANYDGDTPTVRVQSVSVENPTYNLQGIKFNSGVATHGGFTVMTEALFKDFFTLDNLDTDPIILNITYDTSETLKSLHKYSGTRTADIPVAVTGTSAFNISVTDTRDGYMPIGTLSLQETKKVV